MAGFLTSGVSVLVVTFLRGVDVFFVFFCFFFLCSHVFPPTCKSGGWKIQLSHRDECDDCVKPEVVQVFVLPTPNNLVNEEPHSEKG